MGGSSSQVIGYKYYCGLMVAIGNTIEKLININPDNRGWILESSLEDDSVLINKPDLFGGDKQEGGWVGYIDVHTGKPSALEQNHYLAQHESEIVSGFPNLSYLVYHGLTDDKGFHVVSMSGAMKEVLYWVKRTRIKNNGDTQWYERKLGGAIVCEIDSRYTDYRLNDNVVPFNYQFVEKTIDHNQVEHVINTSGSYAATSNDKNVVIDDANSGFAVSFSGGGGTAAKITASVQFKPSIKGISRIRVTASSVANISSINVGFNIISILNESDITEKLNGQSYYTRTKIIDAIVFVDSAGNAATVVSDGAVKQFENDPVLFDKNILSANVTLEIFPMVGDPGGSKIVSPDINPIHKIREILTDDTAMNKPESDVNDANFKAAADRIWDEGLGISWAIQEKTCKEAIDELLYHIEAGIRVNRQTGKYEVILFRDDLLNLDTAMSFNESNIKNLSREVANQDDVINVLNVKYYDRSLIKTSAFAVYDNGSIMSNGNQEIAESVDFPYFMNIRNANLVANWKLKQLSTPTWKGSFSTGKYEARKINKYDVIKLSWLNAGFVDMPVRVMKISLGDGLDNTVSIDWVEVVPYSSTNFQPVNVDQPTNQVLAAQPNVSKVFEMPYFEACQNFGQTQTDAELTNNAAIGYLMIATKKPQNNSLNAQLYTDAGAGYKQQATINYCPTVVLDQNISYLDTSFAVKSVDSISSAEIGSCILIDSEIMVYQAYNATTKVLTVKRGALDTIPQKHNASAMLFFYDAYPSFDTTQYVDNEIVNAKSLTTTPSSVLAINDATPLPLELNARAIRPYPPANIKINNTYYLAESQIVNDLVLTWNHRNRVQQTGGNVLGWVDAAVTKEVGVTYLVQLTENNVVLHNQTAIDASTYTIAKSLLKPNKLHKIKVWSVRNGFDSYQIFENDIFITAPDVTLTATAYNDRVTGTTLAAANVTSVVDETLSANMKWDGTSISGKAEAGATITIEVNN